MILRLIIVEAKPGVATSESLVLPFMLIFKDDLIAISEQLVYDWDSLLLIFYETMVVFHDVAYFLLVQVLN